MFFTKRIAALLLASWILSFSASALAADSETAETPPPAAEFMEAEEALPADEGAEETDLPLDEEGDESEPEEAPAEPEEDDELNHLLDLQELDGLVSQFIHERGINENNLEIAFCYTGTGETYFRNADKYIIGASLYKLSLNMGLARKVAAGELQQSDSIYGMDISYIERRSLVYSDNAVSEALIGYFAPFRDYRLMQAEIAGIPEEELPEEYFSSNTFSARFMLGVLQELWSNTDNYPNVVECMLEANPGEYFRRSMDGKYTVAQKYGGGDGYLHTAGIIYTPTPILLVVMSYRVTKAETVIADLAKLMTDYSLTLDQRRDTILEERAEAERLAQEEAARLKAEEEARIAAEEEAKRLAEEKAEAERLAALEAQQTPQPSPTAEPEKTVRPEEGTEGAARIGVLIVLAVLLAVLIGFYVFQKTHPSTSGHKTARREYTARR
ncbi:MAG: serine hydrolase [Oscillospiraceae bacterium]|nr:serine hydrolase [Oscillospiraceae bacterium]